MVSANPAIVAILLPKHNLSNAFLNLVQQRMQALTKRGNIAICSQCLFQRQLVYNTNPATRFKRFLQVHLLLPDLALDNTQMCITVMTRVGRQARYHADDHTLSLPTRTRRQNSKGHPAMPLGHNPYSIKTACLMRHALQLLPGMPMPLLFLAHCRAATSELHEIFDTAAAVFTRWGRL